MLAEPRGPTRLPTGIAFVEQTWGPLTNALAELLDMRFVPGEPGNETLVGWSLKRIMDLHHTGDVVNRDMHVMRMRMLRKNLSELREGNPQMFRAYRRKLADTDLGNYYGTRFEIAVAASLTRRGTSFTRRSKGGPDFVLGRTKDRVGIECTSKHVADPLSRLQDPMTKLRAAVASKSEEPYAHPGTALAVDVTNLEAVSLDFHNRRLLHSEEAVDEVSHLAATNGFGALLLFWWQAEFEEGGALAGLRHRFAVALGRPSSELHAAIGETFGGPTGFVDPPHIDFPYRT